MRGRTAGISPARLAAASVPIVPGTGQVVDHPGNAPSLSFVDQKLGTPTLDGKTDGFGFTQTKFCEQKRVRNPNGRHTFQPIGVTNLDRAGTFRIVSKYDDTRLFKTEEPTTIKDPGEYTALRAG